MNKIYLNLKEIQKEEVKILKETIKFLDDNNIKYYIAYGTLLGAVRHQGFIPWDDDIDIMILRDEYEKLINILKNNNNKISNNIEAIAFELKNSDWPFIKIVNKKIFIEEESNCDKNLWIDIFPLEYSLKSQKKYSCKRDLIDKLYDFKRHDIYNWKYKSKNIINEILKKIIIKLLKIIKYEFIINKYIKWNKNNYKNINKCKYIVNNIWDSSDCVYKKEWFKDKKFKFENFEVNGIEGYDEFLKVMYGDYMKLPPEEERVTHNIKAYRVNNEKK